MPGIPCGTDLIQTTGRDIRWMGGWLRVEEINRWVKVGEAVLQQSDLHQSATEKDSSFGRHVRCFVKLDEEHQFATTC